LGAFLRQQHDAAIFGGDFRSFQDRRIDAADVRRMKPRPVDVTPPRDRERAVDVLCRDVEIDGGHRSRQRHQRHNDHPASHL
jgi:hypothetical protein